jgi:predicted CoA-binding protein
MDIAKFLDKKTSFAIIGASNSPEKFGFRIFRAVKVAGFKVYPVNYKERLIQGDKAYPTIADLPEKVTVMNFVVPPSVSLEITEKAYSLGYRTFWYQPGSFDQSILDFHTGKDTTVIKDKCLLEEASKLAN